jgi:hypothetical protein
MFGLCTWKARLLPYLREGGLTMGRRHKVLDSLVGPHGPTVDRRRGFTSIGLNHRRQASIAGMTQPILQAKRADTARPDSSGGCHADVA